ncbi:hypothetical protein SprV_0200526500 [Sparganum proliferum]
MPHAILGSDFLAEFDLLVDCRCSCLLDRTTGLSVRGLTPLNDSCNLSVLDTEAPLSLMVDASTVAVGAVLQQHINNSTRPLAFFSKKLSLPTRYSTFGRELIAIYLAVKHFRHFLKGSDFTIFTDHKPLTFALCSHSDKYNPREIVHLDYISQFTTDIHHIDGPKNEVADMLSRPSLSSLQLSHGIDLCAMAAERQRTPPTPSAPLRATFGLAGGYCGSSRLLALRLLTLLPVRLTLLVDTLWDARHVTSLASARSQSTLSPL